MPFPPGARIDRYEILAFLGAGGMGEVYRARDPRLARLVALKVLRPGAAPGTDGPERILREARAAAALSHANVLAIYDAVEAEEPQPVRGTAYIAMELVTGQTMRSYVGDASVSFETRLGWLKDVARALSAAHQVGIVHRDVKPENVMIRGDGAVKVLDFGIARRTRPSHVDLSTNAVHSLPTAPAGAGATDEGVVAGTPLYMAPEQLRGEPVDARADQFSWGVTAYLLLTGVAPWKGLDEPLAVVSQILHVEPTPARQLDAAIPAAVSDVVARALAKDRAARFPSMAQLLAALEGKTPSTLSRLRGVASALRRRPRPRALVAGGLAMALAAVGGSWLARGRESRGASAASGPASAAPHGAPLASARATGPKGAEAARAYAEGLGALRELDYQGARERFQRAVALDDRATMPHAMLSGALFDLGYVQQAEAEAHAALDRAASDAGTREESLVTEARERECAYDWPAAADRWRSLTELFPDDVDYGLALARAYQRAGDPKRALATIDGLRPLPAAAGDPRLDLLASEVASASDYAAQARYADAARADAGARGSRSLALAADVAVARATQVLGHKADAMPGIYEDIGRRYEDAGNRVGVIQMRILVSYSYVHLGRLDDASRAANRAIEDAHAHGYTSLEAKGLMRLGVVQRLVNPATAIPALIQSRDLAHGIGDRVTEEKTMNELALAQWQSGALESGRTTFNEAAELAASIGQKNDETNALDNLANLHEAMGDLRAALATHEEMGKRYLASNNRPDWIITLHATAGLLMDMGEPIEAEKRIDEAVAALGDAPEESKQGFENARGEVLIQRGRYEEGRAVLERGLAEKIDAGARDSVLISGLRLARFDAFHGVASTAFIQRISKDEPFPPAVLAASLLLDGQRERALASARQTIAGASKEPGFLDRGTELVVAGDVLARAGHPAEARALLEPLAAEATARGALLWAFEARLVLARAMPRGAARDAASTALEADARAHDLLDLASRAAALR